MTSRTSARTGCMDKTESALARGGDLVAEILGNVLAQAETGELDERRMSAARDAILQWHQLRAEQCSSI